MENDESTLTPLNFTLPEPLKKSDKLFKWDRDFDNNACINWMHDALPAYADGYKSAADIICANIVGNGGTIDILVYPVCSLYRHYIELRLKEIIKDGHFIFQVESGLPKHHKIYELWKEAKSIAAKIWPEEAPADIEHVDRLILEFSQIDPSSEDFRYPSKRDGSRTLGELKYINIRNLKEVMERVSFLLDGIACGTSEVRSWTADRMSECY